MSETVQAQEYKEISPEMALFYRALGTLNTNLVAKITRDPSTLKTVIANIFDCIASCHPEITCPPQFCWDETEMRCVSNLIGSLDEPVLNG